MKSKLLIGVLLLFYVFSFAQKDDYPISENLIDNKSNKAYYFNLSIGSTHLEDVKNYIIKEFSNLSSGGTNIICQSIIESPFGWHFTFSQEFNGYEIYDTQFKINIDKKGRVLSVFDNSMPVTEALPEEFPEPGIVNGIISSRSTIEYRINHIYFHNGSDFIAALKLQLADKQGNVTESIIDKQGKILYSKDLNMYFHNRSTDSTVTAGVFLPNPLISSGNTYGTPYVDASDSDVQELNSEIFSPSMRVKFDLGIFILESPWAKITEHSAPVTTPATSTIPEFIFTRSKNEFEDVNAYYHINEYQKYLQSLGFTNLVNYQIHIDTHALNGADQSSFSPFFTTPQLNFGEGGVDDAEDAHVILHEYGHAIMHSAAPNTNSGNERQALDEANGDYFAVSYSKAINPFDWHKVFSWDGHNSFWNGRNAASLKLYPQDLSTSYHLNGEIWSSTLMQLNNSIGRELTDQILLQSAYSYASNMKMPDAAILFLQADTLLTQGANSSIICNYFGERGLYLCDPNNLKERSLNSLNIKVLNSVGFAQGFSDAVITLPFALKATLNIFDSTGRLIGSKAINNENSIILSSADFDQGIYFLKFQSSYHLPVVKLARF